MDSAEQAQQNQYASAANAPETVSGTAPAATTSRRRLPRLRPGRRLPILLVLAVLVVTAAGAWYFLYWNSPQHVLLKAFTDGRRIKTLDYTVDGHVQASDRGQAKVRQSAADLDAKPGDTKNREGEPVSGKPEAASLKLDGQADWRDEKTPKTSQTLTIDVDTSFLKGSGGGDIRTVGQEGFARLTSAPDLGEFGDLTPLKDLWFSLDAKELGTTTGNDALEKGLTKDQAKQMRDILKKQRPVKKITKHRDETVAGSKSRHYSVQLDHDGIRDSIVESLKVFQKKDVTDLERRYIDEGLASGILEKPLDIWVGKKDGRVRQIKFQYHQEFDPYVVDASVDFTAKRYDADLKIDKPEGALASDQVEKETTTDTDHDGLNDFIERYFKSDPKKADTDGDGNKDGAEVGGGYDPTKKGKAKLTAEQQHVAKADQAWLGAEPSGSLYNDTDPEASPAQPALGRT